MQQANALSLPGRQPIELEPRLCQIEYSARHVHADDLGELMIGQEAAQRQQYLVSGDGERFLINAATDAIDPPAITLILNWKGTP
jgi:hypothetical protein